MFAEATRAFYSGALSRKDYKGVSGGYGSYAEKSGETGMLRLRMTAGRLTKEKLGFVADMVREHEVKLIKLTTCETVQLHQLRGEQILDIYERAQEYGIFCRGGGGDYPRNVTMSPLSGVQQGEAFDVAPYAERTADYLLGLIGKLRLPRKLKVAFCNGVDDAVHTAFRDLGFAAQADGTFDVYSAGGLGANPKLGVRVAAKVPVEQVLYHARAMAELFAAKGNYENRAKARTRYLRDTLGEEGYLTAYQEYLERALDEGGLDIERVERTVGKAGDGTIADNRVIAQKQQGLYAVQYHPIGGTLSAEVLYALRDALAEMDEVEVRIAPDETIYIINCTAKEAEKLLALTTDGAETLFERSVACIGAPTCQQGTGESQELCRACVQAVREAKLPDGALPRINISGCPSSCAAHQSAVLGFQGFAKCVDGVAQPGFAMMVGGSDALGKAAFGERWGVVLASEVPELLVELGSAAAAAGQDFVSWYPSHLTEMHEIADKYF